MKSCTKSLMKTFPTISTLYDYMTINIMILIYIKIYIYKTYKLTDNIYATKKESNDYEITGNKIVL